MVKSENPQVASLAAIVMEVAKVTAYKKRRLKFLAHKHPELLRKLEETGLVFAHTWDWVPTEVFVQANWEETEFFLREEKKESLRLEDPETAAPSAQEDWIYRFD